MKTLLFLLFSALHVSFLSAAQSPNDILGTWKNSSGKGHIQIFKQNGKFYGKVVWLKNSKDAQGNVKTDRKNADPAKRNQPLLGLVMLHDFVYDNGEWTDGKIYNPSDGKEYKAYMKLQDVNTLSVRGYVGFSLFGKTDVWTRVQR
jgi:uncharacterized protein (DUF2147 family)